MEIFIVYWAVVVILFLVGVIQIIINAANNKPVKPGLRLVIAAVIMLVIGAGACAVILSNLHIGH